MKSGSRLISFQKNRIAIDRECNTDNCFLNSSLFRQIVDQTHFLDVLEKSQEITPYDRVKAVLLNIKEVPSCPICGNPVVLNSNSKFSKPLFSKFCSASCSSTYASRQRKEMSEEQRKAHSLKASESKKSLILKYVSHVYGAKDIISKLDASFIVDKCKKYVNDRKHISSKDIENDDFISGILQMTQFISLPDDQARIESRDDFKFDERLYCIANNISSIPRCKFCNKNQVKFISLKRGYSDVCSDSRCINDKICKRKGLSTSREIKEQIEKDGDYIVLKFPDKFSKEKLEIKCNKCGRTSQHILRNGYIQHLDLMHLCSYCDKYVSREEKVLRKILDDIGDVHYLTNDRDLINPVELDIVIPDKHIAIEFDGFYWHNSKAVKTYYHRNKTDLCKAKGYDLIHVFENELCAKKQAVEANLKRILNPSLMKSIDANWCQIDMSESFEDVKEFVDANSLAFLDDGKYEVVKMTYDGQLVACQVFQERNNNDNQNHYFLLLCTCMRNDVVIEGACQKMIDVFVASKSHKQCSIRACVDNRWPAFKDQYESIGFREISQTKVIGQYYKTSNTRQKMLLKHQLKKVLSDKGVIDSNKSFIDNSRAAGYERICDCGQTVLELVCEKK